MCVSEEEKKKEEEEEDNLKQDQSMLKVSNVLHCCLVKISSFPALNLLCVFSCFVSIITCL